MTFFLLRSPILPYSVLNGICNKSQLMNICSSDIFRDAIVTSNPELYSLLDKWLNGKLDFRYSEKLTNTFLRYLIRMSYRCTPYGIFSGSTIGFFENSTDISLNDFQHHKLFFDLDAEANTILKGSMIRQVGMKNLVHHSRFQLNNTLTDSGEKMLFIESKKIDLKEEFTLSSIAYDSYLRLLFQVIGKQSISMQEFLALPIHSEHDFDNEDAQRIFEFLVENQILILDWNLDVFAKPNTLTQLQMSIENVLGQSNDTLGDIIPSFHMLSKNKVGSLGISFVSTLGLLKDLEPRISARSAIRTDMNLSCKGNILNRKIKEVLDKTLRSLLKVQVWKEDAMLTSFKDEFILRYGEGMLVPLNEVLNVESGIGFPAYANFTENRLITKEISFSHSREFEEIKLSKWDIFIQNKVVDAVRNGSRVIQLVHQDFEDHKLAGVTPMPSSYSSIISIHSESNLDVDISDNFTIEHKSTHGPNGFKLMSRFGPGDSSLANSIREYAAGEQNLNPDVVFAEIDHNEFDRVTSISYRENYYQYRIPILNTSARENTIELSDLMATVYRNELMFFSKRLEVRVIPRLSTAHNHTLSSIPAYLLLCQSQYQREHGYLAWQWGHLNFQTYLPRVMLGNVVLSREKWTLDVRGQSKVDLASEVRKFLNDANVTRYVTIKDGDQELLIDTENILHLNLLNDKLKANNRIVFEESLINLAQASFVRNERGNQSFNNELVIPFLGPARTYSGFPNLWKGYTEKLANSIEHTFGIGSKYIYIKIYCNKTFSSKLLIDLFAPICETLIEKRFIVSFFFLRYFDPNYHLRLRMLCNNEADIWGVWELLFDAVNKSKIRSYIYDIRSESYVKELQRYKFECHSFVENIFYNDSIFSLSIIRATCKINQDKIFQIAVYSTMRYVDELFLTTTERAKFVTDCFERFKYEFNKSDDKTIKSALARFYQKYKQEIFYGLQDTNSLRELGIGDCLDQLHVANSQSYYYISSMLFAEEKFDLVASIIHMHLNRLFVDRPRENEYLVYLFLDRYFKFLFATQGN